MACLQPYKGVSFVWGKGAYSKFRITKQLRCDAVQMKGRDCYNVTAIIVSQRLVQSRAKPIFQQCSSVFRLSTGLQAYCTLQSGKNYSFAFPLRNKLSNKDCSLETRNFSWTSNTHAFRTLHLWNAVKRSQDKCKIKIKVVLCLSGFWSCFVRWIQMNNTTWPFGLTWLWPYGLDIWWPSVHLCDIKCTY